MPVFKGVEALSVRVHDRVIVQNNPVNWIDPDGLSKTTGIQNGDDPYLKRLREANGDREKINEVKREVEELRECKKMDNARWKNVKAWLKLAKDGRLYEQPLIMLDTQVQYLRGLNPANSKPHEPYDPITNRGGSL